MKKLLLTLLLIFLLAGKGWADGNDANTVSLLHMDGADTSTTFTDDAIGGTHTWTAVNQAQIDTAQSKFGGASGLFDGTTDYIYTGDSADFNFGAGNFTVDFWVRFASTTGEQGFYVQADAGGNYIFLHKSSVTHKLRILVAGSGVLTVDYIMTNNWSPSVDTWYHIAFVRNGTVALIFIDGVSQTLTENIAFGTVTIGNFASNVVISSDTDLGGASSINGWIDEYRVSKGIARWTANFTPPTSAYSEVSVASPRKHIIFIQ